jgi:hypothetical protein
MIFRDADSLARHQLKVAGQVRRSYEHRHRAMVRLVEQKAIELVSGTRGGEVERLHPFSVKHLTAFPRLPINIRSGQLRRSLRVFKYARISGQVYRLQFTAPHSKFVLARRGTKTMVPRGFWDEIEKYSRDVLSWSFSHGMAGS